VVFRLRPTAVDDGGAPQLEAAGIDRVEILFSANAGEPELPLDRVASGGELSRVMLAFKAVIESGMGVSSYVFDEVDAGVGGAAAEAIGRRLARAGRGRQVLCITHWPQIAVFADQHLRVDKAERAGRTTTTVRRLDESERVAELARMLGGYDVGASARDHALELLAAARGRREAPRPRARPRSARP
jgi:DNA repair protein RecN (Recombination protein N)